MAGVEVRIGANSDELQKAIKDANKSVESFGTKMRKGVNDAGKYTAGIVAAGTAISVHLVSEAIAAAKEVSNLSRVAGVSANQFQKYAHAAKSVGIEQDKLSDILKDVNDKVGDFLTTGAGGMTDFFEQIAPKVGVTAEQFRGLSGPQALQLYVDSLEKANISQAEMTFHMEALASDATALLPLLRDGGAALAEQAQKAEQLGLALSDIEVAQLEQAGAAVGEIKSIFDGFINQISAEFAPIITAVAKSFRNVAVEAGGVDKAAGDAFNGVIDAAEFVVNAADGVGRSFEVLGKVIAATMIGAKSSIFEMSASFVESNADMFEDVQPFYNKFAKQFNKTFGSDLLATIKLSSNDAVAALSAAAAEADLAFAEASQSIKDSLNRPLAGENFKRFVAEAKAAAEELQVIDFSTGDQGGNDGELNAKDKAAAEAHKKALAERIQRIQESFMVEKDLAAQKLEEDLESIRIAEEAKTITENEALQFREQAHLSHQQTLTDIEQQAADRRKAIAEAEAQNRQQLLTGMFSNLMTLTKGRSEKLFKLAKTAAIANAIVSTASGITKALDNVWPLNLIAAASVAAAGAVQIQAIKSQSFSGGGGVSTSTGGAVSSAAQAPAGATSGGGGGGQGPLQVSLSGISRDQNYSGADLADLFDKLSDEAGDRGLQFALQR